MLQTLFAWLASNLSKVFSLTKSSAPPARNPESSRPLEQIINEGSHGEVEKIPVGGCYAINPTMVEASDRHIKTQAEEDYEHIKVKLVNEGIVCISDKRYDGLLKLAYINKEVDEWLNGLGGVGSKAGIILIPNLSNIGIVRC